MALMETTCPVSSATEGEPAPDRNSCYILIPSVDSKKLVTQIRKWVVTSRSFLGANPARAVPIGFSGRRVIQLYYYENQQVIIVE